VVSVEEAASVGGEASAGGEALAGSELPVAKVESAASIPVRNLGTAAMRGARQRLDHPAAWPVVAAAEPIARASRHRPSIPRTPMSRRARSPASHVRTVLVSVACAIRSEHVRRRALSGGAASRMTRVARRRRQRLAKRARCLHPLHAGTAWTERWVRNFVRMACGRAASCSRVRSRSRYPAATALFAPELTAPSARKFAERPGNRHW
jgi:hypothetical protein